MSNFNQLEFINLIWIIGLFIVVLLSTIIFFSLKKRKLLEQAELIYKHPLFDKYINNIEHSLGKNYINLIMREFNLSKMNKKQKIYFWQVEPLTKALEIFVNANHIKCKGQTIIITPELSEITFKNFSTIQYINLFNQSLVKINSIDSTNNISIDL